VGGIYLGNFINSLFLSTEACSACIYGDTVSGFWISSRWH